MSPAGPDVLESQVQARIEALQAELRQLEARVEERTAALRLSEGRLANLVSLSADWIWEQDADLRFSYFSAGFQARTGAHPSLLLGRRRFEGGAFEAPEEAVRQHLAQLSSREPFRDFVYGYRRPDGSKCYLRISGEPVFGEGGTFQGYRGVGCDETQATLAAQRVQRLACYDNVTGLPNRNMFVAELEHALARARRNSTTFALCFIDLDRFKAINDTLGHAAGDDLLRTLAERLRALLRESDLVARLGGDEFVVLLEGHADTAALAIVAHKMLGAVSEPMLREGRRLRVTGSCGIAIFPDDGADADTLLKNADTAMYEAKAEGKNNTRFYTAAMAQRAANLHALESDLRLALERGELILHYQPKIDLASGDVRGVEALLRWRHPERGLLAADGFIALAEECGLILQLGRWVLHEACRQLRAWRDAGIAAPRCSVNLSARQFCSESLQGDVLDALASAGIAADLIEVEITETVLMSDPDSAGRILQRLHHAGVHIAIDDFGTGYSSLAYLRRFPAGTVKIDRSFVHGLPDDADDSAITLAVIALSHSLGLQVVAEGVESQDQFDFLRRMGCDQAQGHLIDPPMPAAQIAQRLQRQLALGGAAADGWSAPQRPAW